MQDATLEVLTVFLLHGLFGGISITELNVGEALSIASLPVLGYVNLIGRTLATIPDHDHPYNAVVG